MADGSPYPLLFSPLQVGPVQLRNRLLLSPMTTGFGFPGGGPDERALAYFTERSRDVAMVVVPFGAVSPEGRVEDQIAWMYRPDAAEAMRPLADAIAGAGALPCLQLGHGGRQVSPRVIGAPPVAPSPLPPAVHTDVAPRALSIGEVEDIVAAFGRAAHRAARAGFAAVEIHGAHGYLVQQFLSPQSNERTDRYGGHTVEQRARFGADVIAEVRRSAPELLVSIRINGSDVVPGGLTPSDAARAAQVFVAAGAQMLVVSAGIYGSVPYTIPLLDDQEATFLDECAFVRSAVDVPVVAVGRFSLPATAEAALRSGQCSAVAIGRGLLADPQWAAKARDGRSADIRPCIATVQGCAGMLQHGGEISCAVNPSVGREGRAPLQLGRPRSMVVIGAGAAGLEAARRGAELGHRVVLHEARPRVGGAVALAAETPVLAHLRRLVTWYERQLGQLGVDVRLASPVAEARADDADLVVVAAGAATVAPMIDGYDALPAWTLEDLLTGGASTLGTSTVPAHPVVLGGGTAGAERGAVAVPRRRRADRPQRRAPGHRHQRPGPPGTAQPDPPPRDRRWCRARSPRCSRAACSGPMPPARPHCSTPTGWWCASRWPRTGCRRRAGRTASCGSATPGGSATSRRRSPMPATSSTPSPGRAPRQWRDPVRRAQARWLNDRPRYSETIRVRWMVGVPPPSAQPCASRWKRSMPYSSE